MKNVKTWLDQYGESHTNPINKTIHWVCIPLIVFSLLGLLASVPIPGATPFVHLGTVVCAAAIAYYFVLSPALAVGMIGVSAATLAVVAALSTSSVPLWAISLTVFVAAWIGQFVGHKIEGKKPSFFEDLQFLLIGPMWLLADLYRRVGIGYGASPADPVPGGRLSR